MLDNKTCDVDVIYNIDCITGMKKLPDECINVCVTSPPYWGLRDYQTEGQIGNENNIRDYLKELNAVFSEVRRILRNDGTLWLNLGDRYEKGDLIGLPWLVVFELKKQGWILRSEIIWHKPAPMPQPAKNRPTQAHEQIFLLTKNKKYYYDYEAIATDIENDGPPRTFRKKKEGSKRYDEERPYTPRTKANKRDVWKIPMEPQSQNGHVACYPTKLIEPCIKAGCPKGGIVLDPFMGSGTTAVVAKKLGMHWIGYELNERYCKMANKRISESRIKINDVQGWLDL